MRAAPSSSKGLEALQAALLMAIVAAAGALIAQSVLHNPPSVPREGAADVVLILDNYNCGELLKALKPAYGEVNVLRLNAGPKIALLVRVLSPGTLKGVILVTKEGYKLFRTPKVSLSPGLYLLCFNGRQRYNVTDAKLIGFSRIG